MCKRGNDKLSLSLKEIGKVMLLYLLGSVIAGTLSSFLGDILFGYSLKNIVLGILNPILLVVIISWYVMKEKELTIRDLVGKQFFKPANKKVYLSVILLVLGSSIFQNWLIQFDFIHISSSKPEMNILFYFMKAVLLYPLTEEIIFRGIILRGALSKYRPVKAIIISIIAFSIIHVLISRILLTFISGIIYGLIYYKSRSLIFTIMYHSIHNFIVLAKLYNFIKFKVAWWYSLLGIILMVIGYLLFDKFLENDSDDLRTESI